ncbi:hypothetical protein H257_03763 [Aphanomyces astaci]|uniref:Putative auto-transporter adhesin head GIN domain-containing protein n=1 Tax=Aphanomyces astaci TaxID=112090 RepID=W4GY75_APHAT|nr:hypothetical protein H257_03763 [Aphanomyces astaci]ETV84597.1 hypothetical protein H257_03763 [Aphanomyces astaci]RQM18923.1 hypothetical protein B5M09_009509 [Aphanomyces astaci]|eukprot:XP_009826289.1 hypothetical protein H257_03763 [Aphanomyces astaci]
MSITAPNTFTKSWNTTASSIEGILLQFPGRVYVNQDPYLKATALVEVTSNSQAVLDLIAFNATQAVGNVISVGCNRHVALAQSNQTYLNVSATSDVDAYAVGSLLVRVTVQRAVSWIKSTADTVLVSGSLVNGANRAVSIAALGTGNITTTAKYPVTLSNLTLSTTGAGNVQFAATTNLNVTNGLSLLIVGSGSVALQAARDITVRSLQTSVAGSGSVFALANGSLKAQNVRTSLAGKGNVSYSTPQGSTINNTISAAGSGHVYSGSLFAQNATVTLAGSGDVVVQVIDTLTAIATGEGKVLYYNKTGNPAHLPERKGWWVFSSPSAEAIGVNPTDQFTLAPEPLKEPVNVRIELNASSLSHCVVQTFKSGGQVSLAASGAQSPVDVATLGGVAVAFLMLIALVMFKKQKRVAGYVALPK